MSDGKLNVRAFSDVIKCISIGRLEQNMIDVITTHRPELEGVLRPTEITLWEDRIEYTGKHKDNFLDVDDYYRYLEDIPSIISEPDYIGVPPDNQSIQFIKQYDHNIVVAVRISANGKLSYRTMYPITESQINDYQRKDRLWKFAK